MPSRLFKKGWGLKDAILISMAPLFVIAGIIGIGFNYSGAQESAQKILADYTQQRKMELKFIANIPTLKIFITDLRLGLKEEAAFFQMELEETLEDFFSDPAVPKTHLFMLISPAGEELLRVSNGKIVPTQKEIHGPQAPKQDDIQNIHKKSHVLANMRRTFQKNPTTITTHQLLDPINNTVMGSLVYEYDTPVNELLKHPRRIMWANLILGFSSIGILFLLFYLIVDFYIQPLYHLTASVRRMIKGNLDQEIAPSGIGETLLLSRSFEEMRSQLHRSFSEIREKNSELAHLLEEQQHITSQLSIKNSELEDSKAQLIQSEEKLATTLYSIGDAVFATDEKGIVVSMNPVAEKLCGWRLKEARGKPLVEIFVIINSHTREPVTNPVEKVFRSGKVEGLEGHTILVAKDGQERQIADSAAPIRNKKGEIIGVVLVASDVSEKVAQEEKLRKAQEELTKSLEYQLYVDELTQLGSRAKLLKDIKTSHRPAVILIDINSFRTINELYGLEVGNEVLIILASILKEFASLKKYETYRISGDEFVLFKHTTSTSALSCNTLLVELFRFIKKRPISPSLLGEELYLDISAGASFEATNPLETANTALNHAKQNYFPYAIFSKEMDLHEEVTYGALWKKKIILGLQRSAFVPFFQPIVDRQQNVIKYEALVRFCETDEENTYYVAPHEFLEVAIKTRYYNKISQITLLKSLNTCAKEKISVSLNLSYQDVLNTELCKILKKTIEKNSIGSAVIFEIVESQNIKDYEILKAFISEFKAIGVRFAIDDFGTGFSNFAHIFELSPDFIKIDGSLIKNIDTDKKSLELVKAIVFFSKEMGIKTVAEFVHSKEVFEIALDLGIDFFQGYYFGKPSQWES